MRREEKKTHKNANKKKVSHSLSTQHNTLKNKLEKKNSRIFQSTKLNWIFTKIFSSQTSMALVGYRPLLFYSPSPSTQNSQGWNNGTRSRNYNSNKFHSQHKKIKIK
jgi:hypothetical protein